MKTFKLLLATSFLISAIGFASSIPKTIKGALLISPAEVHPFILKVTDDGKCESTSLQYFEKTNCNLVNSEAVFESSSGKDTVPLTLLHEIEDKQERVNGPVRSYALSGNWEVNAGITVKSRIKIALHEFKDKPKEYVGYVEFLDYGYNKIPLSAKGE